MNSGRHEAQQAPLGPWLVWGTSAKGKWRHTGTAAALAGVGGPIPGALQLYTGPGVFFTLPRIENPRS
jgi:hypothetical protein